MGWRERLVPAEFRGVRLWVESSTGTKGRRVAVRKFAGRDGSEQQDTGREPDEFEVVAYLWGDDYDYARDDLEVALAESGPAALTIPTRGDLWVRVTRGPITTEHKDEGGYCTVRFSVVVEEREGARGLRVRVDTRAELVSSSSAVRKASASDFAKAANTKGLAERYMDNTLRTVDAFTRKIGSITRSTQTLLSPLTSLTTRLDALNQTSNTLLATPSLFATQALDAIFTVFASIDTVIGGIDRATGLPLSLRTPFQRGQHARRLDRAGGAFRGFGEPFLEVATSSLLRQAEANTLAVARLARAGVLAAQALALAQAEFDSASFALEALARALAEIDAVCLLRPSDALFTALADLRAKLTRYVLETASRLPETVVYAPPRPVPALVLAYDLYGDVAMEADLVARNRAPAPLYLTGRLEVLAP